MFDPQGRQMIKDRKKYLSVSSDRKGIVPQAVEHIVPRRKNVYQNIPAGNARIFLGALIVPACALR